MEWLVLITSKKKMCSNNVFIGVSNLNSAFDGLYILAPDLDWGHTVEREKRIPGSGLSPSVVRTNGRLTRPKQKLPFSGDLWLPLLQKKYSSQEPPHTHTHTGSLEAAENDELKHTGAESLISPAKKK